MSPRRSLGSGARAYKGARLPSGRTRWNAASYCAVDLELTGLDPKLDEIISFAAIPIEQGRVRLSAAVSGRARPRRPSGEAAIRIHGLRAADLADEPPLEQAIEPLLAAMAGRVPVVHVAAIERGFLGPALRRQGLRLHGPMIDTSVVGRLWLRVQGAEVPPVLSLAALAESLGLPVHHPHDALADALTTAQVFVVLASHLDARRPESVRSLRRANARLHPLIAGHLRSGP